MHFYEAIILFGTIFRASPEVINISELTEPYLIRFRIKLLTRKLHKRCPELVDHGMFIGKRDIINRLTHEDTLEMTQIIYNHIQLLLTQCYSTTGVTTETPSTFTPTTANITLPSQCTSSSTITLNESWRKDFGHLNWNSDQGELDMGRFWFRFSGAAGSLLSYTCPAFHNCGSTGAYWNDSPLPTENGETVYKTFYESFYPNSGCRE